MKRKFFKNVSFSFGLGLRFIFTSILTSLSFIAYVFVFIWEIIVMLYSEFEIEKTIKETEMHQMREPFFPFLQMWKLIRDKGEKRSLVFFVKRAKRTAHHVNKKNLLIIEGVAPAIITLIIMAVAVGYFLPSGSLDNNAMSWLKIILIGGFAWFVLYLIIGHRIKKIFDFLFTGIEKTFDFFLAIFTSPRTKQMFELLSARTKKVGDFFLNLFK